MVTRLHYDHTAVAVCTNADDGTPQWMVWAWLEGAVDLKLPGLRSRHAPLDEVVAWAARQDGAPSEDEIRAAVAEGRAGLASRAATARAS